MANRTDPMVSTVHGTNPQFLVEKILRQKIYNSLYWKEQCFGLTAETLIDKAVGLTAYGGQYGGLQKPTKFMCLVLKMLQLQPEKGIVVEFIKNEDYKYLRVLGAFYLRLVGKPLDIYQYLEPLYNDYRKLRFHGMGGWALKHMDEFIDELLTGDYCCDVALPHLPKRHLLEDQKLLTPRVSALEDEDLDLLDEEEEEELEKEEEGGNGGKEAAVRNGRPKEPHESSDEEAQKEDKDHGRDRGHGRRHSHSRSRSRGRDKERRRDSRGSSRSNERHGHHHQSHSHRRPREHEDDYGEEDRPKRRRHHSRSRSHSPRRGSRDDHRERPRRKKSRSPSSASSLSSSSSSSRSRSSSRGRRGGDESAAGKEKKRKPKKVPVIKGLKLHKVVSDKKPSSSLPSSAGAQEGGGGGGGGDGKSVDEWNEMRAKLGLKPLQD